MFEDDDDETCSLTLRSISKRTSRVLYEIKALTGKPICRSFNKMVRYYVENHPDMLAQRAREIQQLIDEYSPAGAIDPTPSVSGTDTSEANRQSAEPQPRSPFADALKRLSAML